MKKTLLSLLFCALSSSAFALDWIAPPTSDSEEISTRGADLCLTFNQIQAYLISFEMLNKHEKVAFPSEVELMLDSSFDTYYTYIFEAGVLSEFLTKSSTSLVSEYRVNSNTIEEVRDYYTTASLEDLNKIAKSCSTFALYAKKVIDPDNLINIKNESNRAAVAKELLAEIKSLADEKINK